MKTIAKLLFIVLIMFSCNSPVKEETKINVSEEEKSSFLKDSRWEFKIAEDCVSYYLFKDDGKSIYYSCESEDTYYGTYYVENDTIYLHNTITDRDSLLSEAELSHHSEEAKYKLIIENGTLRHVERWSFSKAQKIWMKDDFEFGDDFVFIKVQ